MTGERTKLDALENKLGNICDENVLTYRLTRDRYPLSLTIRPNDSPDGQLTMLEVADVADTGFISPDASIVFMFIDGSLKIRTSETFNISEALFSKLKNIFIKWHTLWQQHFFREVVTQNLLALNAWPSINYKVENDGNKSKEDGDIENGGSENDEPDLENDDDDFDDDDDDGSDDDGGESESETTITSLAEEAALVEDAIKIVREAGTATVSLLQKKLCIGYAKASRLMEALEARGVVGPFNGASPREVLPAGDGDA